MPLVGAFPSAVQKLPLTLQLFCMLCHMSGILIYSWGSWHLMISMKHATVIYKVACSQKCTYVQDDNVQCYNVHCISKVSILWSWQRYFLCLCIHNIYMHIICITKLYINIHIYVHLYTHIGSHCTHYVHDEPGLHWWRKFKKNASSEVTHTHKPGDHTSLVPGQPGN